MGSGAIADHHARRLSMPRWLTFAQVRHGLGGARQMRRGLLEAAFRLCLVLGATRGLLRGWSIRHRDLATWFGCTNRLDAWLIAG